LSRLALAKHKTLPEKQLKKKGLEVWQDLPSLHEGWIQTRQTQEDRDSLLGFVEQCSRKTLGCIFNAKKRNCHVSVLC
jgi:hypothetical protein